MDPVDEIKQKLDIATVVGEYVQLKKAGSSLKGKCPFHNEKTPSFFVHPDRGFYYCFGCNEGGDIFSFVQKVEGLDFPEALRLLAQKSGVKLEKFDPRTTSLKNRLFDICNLTATYWQEKLSSHEGKAALEYVQKRGLSSLSIKDFKIGYASDSWGDLMNFLQKKGFNESEIFQAGLTVRKDKGTGYYDRFRDRIIFPIQDIHSNVVGFTARAMKDDVGAKYINTNETPIYHKSDVLYGLDKAKQAIRKQDYAVVVEGNMDVIACHQAGYKNVVACSGTALTPNQIKFIKRYTENVILCFDQDEAGKAAARRSIELLYNEEMNIKIIKLISGKDPDECIKNNPNDWVESIKSAKPPMQYLIDENFNQEVLADVLKKKKAAKILLQELSKIKNKIERDYWLKQLAIILDVSVEVLYEANGTKKDVNSGKEKSKVEPQIQEKTEIDKVLTIIINQPELIGYAQEYLLPEMIVKDQFRKLYSQIVLCYNQIEDKSKANIIQCLEKEELAVSQSYFSSLIIYIDQAYVDFSKDELKEELINLINFIKKKYLNNQIRLLNSQLQLAEKQKDSAQVEEIIKKIQNYNEQLAKFK